MLADYKKTLSTSSLYGASTVEAVVEKLNVAIQIAEKNVYPTIVLGLEVDVGLLRKSAIYVLLGLATGVLNTLGIDAQVIVNFFI